ncbi:prophage terminase, large subunit [Escherichia coli]|nr:prophage terminase, large subunit [Escherichia coli]
MQDAEKFNIRRVGFDTWNATHLRTQLQGAGFEVEPFPQTYLRFSPAAKSFEVFVKPQGDCASWRSGVVLVDE